MWSRRRCAGCCCARRHRRRRGAQENQRACDAERLRLQGALCHSHISCTVNAHVCAGMHRSALHMRQTCCCACLLSFHTGAGHCGRPMAPQCTAPQCMAPQCTLCSLPDYVWCASAGGQRHHQGPGQKGAAPQLSSLCWVSSMLCLGLSQLQFLQFSPLCLSQLARSPSPVSTLAAQAAQSERSPYFLQAASSLHRQLQSFCSP